MVELDLDSDEVDAYDNYVAGLRQSCRSGDDLEGVDLLHKQPKEYNQDHLLMADFLFDGKQKTLRTSYTSPNLYLVAYQDSAEDWWEFEHEGEKHFETSKSLGYVANYVPMGDISPGFVISRENIRNAVEVLWKGNISNEEKKKYLKLKLLIIIGPESARLDPVFTLVSNAYRTWIPKSLEVKHIEMIKNWSAMCGMLHRKASVPEKHPLCTDAELSSYKDIAKVLRLCLRQ